MNRKPTNMNKEEINLLICEKRELNTKVIYWENQKRISEKRLQKLDTKIKELEKEIAKEATQ